MRATSNDNPKVWENRMRREAKRQGFELIKLRGRDLWILERPRSRTATGFSDTPTYLTSLYEVDEYLRKRRERIEEILATDAAQDRPNGESPGQTPSWGAPSNGVTAGDPRTPTPGHDAPNDRRRWSRVAKHPSTSPRGRAVGIPAVLLAAT